MARPDTTRASNVEGLLTVVNGNWGATSLAAVRAVLASAYDVLTNAFGTPPDAPVRVARWDQDPRALDHKRPYEIRLNARDRYWCQYVYQFSHELCHAMTGFDRHGKHKHKWFEETLGEMASLFVLYRLATVWEETPPRDIVGAKDFASNHRSYAEAIQAKCPEVLDSHLPEWLARNIEHMETDRYIRDINRVVAVSLLGRFREDPSLWEDCASLNRWDPGVDATFADYLDSWAASLPQRGRTACAPIVVREVLQVEPAGSSTKPAP